MNSVHFKTCYHLITMFDKMAFRDFNILKMLFTWDHNGLQGASDATSVHYRDTRPTIHTQPMVSCQLLRAANAPVVHLLFRFVSNLSLVWFYMGSLFTSPCLVDGPHQRVAL